VTRQHELLSGLGQYRVDAGLIFGQPATPGRVGLPLALSLRLAYVPRAGLMVFKDVRDLLPDGIATWASAVQPTMSPKVIPCISRAISAQDEADGLPAVRFSGVVNPERRTILRQPLPRSRPGRRTA
jgi:hypothetical protein